MDVVECKNVCNTYNLLALPQICAPIRTKLNIVAATLTYWPHFYRICAPRRRRQFLCLFRRTTHESHMGHQSPTTAMY